MRVPVRSGEDDEPTGLFFGEELDPGVGAAVVD